MPKSILNGLLFLALWLVAGYYLFQFFQWTEPVLTSWIDLLLYGRITEFWGATRFILWVCLFMLVHLSSYLASLFVGPLILHYMERQPALRITRT